MYAVVARIFRCLYQGEGGQGVSEYAVLLVLLVLIVVSAVHAIGMNAHEVIDRVSDALQSL